MATTSNCFDIANQSASTGGRRHNKARPMDYAAFFISLPTILVGLVTNILIVFVMRRLKISKTARFLYITIAVFDCGVLLTFHLCLNLLKRGLSAVSGGRIVVAVDGSFLGCKLMYLASFGAEGLANLMAALLAFDRYMRVCRPFVKLTYRGTRILSLSCILLSIAVHASAYHVIVFVEKEGKQRCLISSDLKAQWLLLFSLINDAVLPGFAIVLFNWLILAELRRRRQCGLPATNVGADASKVGIKAESKSANKQITQSRQSKSQSESVAVLLYMSIIFVVIFTPAVITHIFCITSSTFCAAKMLVYQLTGFVHSTNFFVYYACMKRFRREVGLLLHSIGRTCSCGLFKKRTFAAQCEIELQNGKLIEQKLASKLRETLTLSKLSLDSGCN